jgi:hypothetical protein
VEEFGASGLAWRRIVEGIIVEKLWKHLLNAAPGVLLKNQEVMPVYDKSHFGNMLGNIKKKKKIDQKLGYY